MLVRSTMLALTVLTAAPVFAQQAPPPPSKLEAGMQTLQTYCKSDIMRVCPDVEPGGGRLKECLIARQDALTVGCAKALQKLKQ